MNSVLVPVDKPPYRVPSMAEIAAVPWNGLKVASTFSGCGGSCFGYRMAGFRVVWANEFVPAAQDSYRANMAPGSILDTRDIRAVQPADILKVTGLSKGELDLFDGSPPCQAFSTAGKRQKGWGQAKKYEHGATQCNETLFGEYVRILRGLMPKVFVAENVSGLVKGVAKGYFLEILRDLKVSGYKVEARLLDAQWLGVPQMRQRIIFVGVRSDLGKSPAFPTPLPYRYSVRDALPELVGRVAAGNDAFDPIFKDVESVSSATIMAGDNARQSGWVEVVQSGVYDEGERVTDGPCPSVTREGIGAKRRESVVLQLLAERRKFTIAELRRICAFPDDFTLTGSYAQQWERLGNSVPPVMMAAIARTIRDSIFVHGDNLEKLIR